MIEGAVVQTTKRVLGPYPIKRGTRGRVSRVDGDWLTVELPSGGRFEAHLSEVAVLLRNDVDL